MTSYVVINVNKAGGLVVQIFLNSRGQKDAVLRRIDELGGTKEAAESILAVSNPIPSKYGAGGAQLYPVKLQTPPSWAVEVGAIPVKAHETTAFFR